MENPAINNEDITDEWFLASIREDVPQKDCYTEEDLLTVAKIFYNYFMIGNFNYCGIDNFANHQYGILLDKAINLQVNTPERTAIGEKMKDFRNFSIEYFHYDPHEQKFIDGSQQ